MSHKSNIRQDTDVWGKQTAIRSPRVPPALQQKEH